MAKEFKLMKSSQWASREFEKGSIPTSKTIKRWVQDGVINGRIIDQSVWVFSSERMGVASAVTSHVNALIEDD
ncbi:hypothetical protein SJZ84_21420 [Hafnia paralvei]|uniref:hypothetical protein n=1 Tax=Hafnia paralvei TaxID=546367 RepID=UPI00076B2FE9|nr:hypothetical protein [Hafnia paralvei]AMH18657.1 hypothetical protein AL518_11930 [Hafnia paralvei]MCE9904493.1 hypothetical protein [Hafnia paralvei]MCE9920976.1 hypothetical protein [Hafnia paralvei]MDX6913372.1 hypothetical protein [Hafnia paralvei]TBM14760.1 hypothetical protein EYY86_09765 [Hafnia paralvei]